MKKIIAIGIIGVLLLTASSSLAAVVQKREAADLSGGGYIQSLIDAAEPGDTIYIPSGVYYGNVLIYKPITLIGENKEDTCINGDGSAYTVCITADDVKIQGFTIKGGYGQIAEIFVTNSKNSIISENIIDNEHIGIDVEYSSNIEISYNNITRVYAGIFCSFSCSNIKIIGNYICAAWWTSIYLGYIDDNVVTNNVLRNSSYLGLIFFGENNIISRNIIENNKEVGINVLGSNNEILENDIRNNQQGISIKNMAYSNTISKNNITNNNHAGIISYGSDLNVISKNKIEGNHIGVSLSVWEIDNWPDPPINDSSDFNKVYHNNFINNDQNAFDDYRNFLNVWFQGTTGNYWDDYDGVDILPPWGIGDTPYEIPDKNCKDMFPLMNPYDNNPYNVNKNSQSSQQQSQQLSFLQQIIKLLGSPSNT